MSWWMLSPGPKRLLIPTVKKKISTLSNLISKGNYASIIETIFNYINIFFAKIGIFEILY